MNIFKTLKRGNSREEEYFSAALAILLDEIPELTTYLLDEILGISDDLEEYEIIPEYPVLDGRVDIAIKSIHFEIFIENKISSGLYESQLERYSKHLESIDKETKLILLTRDFIDDETIPKYTDKYIFWTELYTLIEQFTNSISACVEFEIDSKKYLLKQFLNFLKEENMSDEKVSWEYIEGIKSFMNLLNMIQSSLDQLKREKTINNYGNKSIGKNYAGFYKISVIKIVMNSGLGFFTQMPMNYWYKLKIALMKLTKTFPKRIIHMISTKLIFWPSQKKNKRKQFTTLSKIV